MLLNFFYLSHLQSKKDFFLVAALVFISVHYLYYVAHFWHFGSVANPTVHAEYSKIRASDVCSTENITKNLALFAKYKTNCPSEPWYWDWQATLNVNEFVGLEIGCNKGTDALMNLRAFTASTLVDIDSFEKHTKLKEYVCNFDRERWKSLLYLTKPRAKKYRHYCIEAAVENAGAVREATSILKLDKLGLSVHHVAVSSSSKPSTIKFPFIKPGTENVGIGTSHDKFKHFYDVQVTTVDEFVSEKKINQVDVLKIDTEGNDALVLTGAVKTLVLMKPSYLMFENHKVGHWATVKLKDVIDFLDAVDYDCFWATNSDKLIRITGCWASAYDIKKKWSNIACHHRYRDDLRLIMNKYI